MSSLVSSLCPKESISMERGAPNPLLLRFADISISFGAEVPPSDKGKEKELKLTLSKVRAAAAPSRISYVMQRECVFTKDGQLATTAFNACYVLTGHDPTTGFKFMAHIDDCTTINSIKLIFKNLSGLGVNTSNLTSLSLSGGWKIMDSYSWGQQIIKILKDEALLSRTDCSRFQKKSPASLQEYEDSEDPYKHGFTGGMVKENGRFGVFQFPWEAIARAAQKMGPPPPGETPLKMYLAENGVKREIVC